MTDKKIEQQFVARVREALEQGSGRLEPDVRSRLSRIRHEAVARRRSRPRQGRRWRYAAGVLATATLAGLMLSLPFNRPNARTPLAAMDDMDILAASEPFEIYEDMEFYSWLSELKDEIQNS
jgi:hypothetical protein